MAWLFLSVSILTEVAGTLSLRMAARGRRRWYAAVAVGAAVGSGPEAHSWLVSMVWVLVWSLTAWLNARMVEKVLLRGWAGRWTSKPSG